MASLKVSKHVQTFFVSDAFYVLGGLAMMRGIQREVRFLTIHEAIEIGIADLGALQPAELIERGATFTAHEFLGGHQFHLALPSTCTATIRHVQNCICKHRGRKLTRLEVVLLAMLKVSG